MKAWSAVLCCALPALSFAAPGVRVIERVGGDYRINGAPAPYVGSGDFKEVLGHPGAPELVVKVFYNKWTSSVPEMRREVGDIRRLENIGAAPKLVEQGAVMLDGKPAGFLVQEKVVGGTLERPTAEKLAHVRRLFSNLAAHGIELGDTLTDFKLRENIMVGRTRSGGTKAWVVDADLNASTKSPEELKAFYNELFDRISRKTR